MLSEQGEPLGALSGINWEIGDLKQQTQASHPWAWWVPRENGVEERVRDLGKEEGLRHFGYRLGTLARRLAIVLQPRANWGFGGYVARYWPLLELGIRRELESLLIAGEPPITCSPRGVAPYLCGSPFCNVLPQRHCTATRTSPRDLPRPTCTPKMRGRFADVRSGGNGTPISVPSPLMA